MDKITPKSSDVFKANLDRAAPLLAKVKADGIGHIIDGKIVPSISGQTFEAKSPVDGSVLATVARGNAEDIDRAATAASQAFKAWRDMPATMRKKLLHRVADAIEDHADDIAVLECVDTGQAHRFMAKAAIRGAENFRFFADKCTDARDGGEHRVIDGRLGLEGLARYRRHHLAVDDVPDAVGLQLCQQRRDPVAIGLKHIFRRELIHARAPSSLAQPSALREYCCVSSSSPCR